jgi:hypothetical protein
MMLKEGNMSCEGEELMRLGKEYMMMRREHVILRRENVMLRRRTSDTWDEIYVAEEETCDAKEGNYTVKKS